MAMPELRFIRTSPASSLLTPGKSVKLIYERFRTRLPGAFSNCTKQIPDPTRRDGPQPTYESMEL